MVEYFWMIRLLLDLHCFITVCLAPNSVEDRIGPDGRIRTCVAASKMHEVVEQDKVEFCLL
jgi:hypothetical protein